MNLEEWKKIHNYCMNKPCVYESRPFGNTPICYRVAGKIFVQLTAQPDWYKATIKTNPLAAEFYRQAYPGIIVRGYHCPPVQQPYWNTIDLNQVPFDLVCKLIDEGYDELVAKLTKKEQKRLPERAHFQFVKTNGEHKDFMELCQMLDDFLNEAVGGEKQRNQYNQYNTLESIHDVIVIYKDDEAVGAGAYKFFDEDTVEMKRIFIKEEYRGIGLGRELLLRLEADARIKGFRYGILETGDVLEAATASYKKNGYKVIPNYGQYADMPESVCMQKKL